MHKEREYQWEHSVQCGHSVNTHTVYWSTPVGGEGVGQQSVTDVFKFGALSNLQEGGHGGVECDME